MKIINENNIRQIVKESLLALLENSDKYNIFLNHFNHFVSQTISTANSELKKYGLTVEINEEYEFFDDDEWLACYERTSNYIEDDIIMIALNREKIYNAMLDLESSEDINEIEIQAIVTIMHEVGHGLVDWLRYQFDGEMTTSNLINDIIYCDEDEEEEICEEYGERWIAQYSGVYDSVLEKALKEYDTVDIK
ncbi:MAG: hypothetical protein J6J23_05265 [Clostridia bacterium]|nr:hypothetical protein [Clostridia bacterium]